MDPPGWPDFAPVTILMMSLLTWEEILFNSSILAIVRLVKNSRQIVFMSIRLLMQAQNYLNFFSHKNLTVTKFEKTGLAAGTKKRTGSKQVRSSGNFIYLPLQIRIDSLPF